MKKKEKIIILALALILIVVVTIIIARKKDKSQDNAGEVAQQSATQEEQKTEDRNKYVQVLEDGQKLNKSEALAKSKTFKNLEFTNMQLTYRGDKSVLFADVQNKGSEAMEMTAFDIEILNEKGEKITTIGGLIPPLEPNAMTRLQSVCSRDISNAYDFKIVESR